MLTVREAKDRAVERAICTGDLPNIDLIHTIQRADGLQPCFGRPERQCPNTRCPWYTQCMALVAFHADLAHA
jgi:hypothetical protein